MKFELFTKQMPLDEYIETYRNVDKFIVFCKECPGYGKTWVCPPFESHQPLEEYNHITIIGSKIYHQSQPIDSAEQMMHQGVEILAPIREKIDNTLLSIEAAYPSSLALFPGSCRLCPKGECTRLVGQPCSKPNQARSSLEALGFDVGRTTSELLGIEMKWGSATSLPEYYTLVYGLLSMEPLDAEAIQK